MGISELRPDIARELLEEKPNEYIDSVIFGDKGNSRIRVTDGVKGRDGIIYYKTGTPNHEKAWQGDIDSIVDKANGLLQEHISHWQRVGLDDWDLSETTYETSHHPIFDLTEEEIRSSA